MVWTWRKGKLTLEIASTKPCDSGSVGPGNIFWREMLGAVVKEIERGPEP